MSKVHRRLLLEPNTLMGCMLSPSVEVHMQKFIRSERVDNAPPAIVNAPSMREPLLFNYMCTKNVFEAIEDNNASLGIVHV